MDNIMHVLLVLLAGAWAFALHSIARERNLRRMELKEALDCIDDLQARVKALEERA